MSAQHAFLVDLWANDPWTFWLAMHQRRPAKPRGPAAEFGAAAVYHEGLALPAVKAVPQARNRWVPTLGGVCALLKRLLQN